MNDKIIQKQEIKEDYKRKQKLIVHKLGNVLLKTHYGHNILTITKSHFKIPLQNTHVAILDGWH